MPQNRTGKKRDRTKEYARYKERMATDPEFAEEERRKSRERAREYRDRNRDKINRYAKEYRERNLEACRERDRRRVLDNPEKERARYRRYYWENVDELRRKARERKAANPEANREAERRRRLRKKGGNVTKAQLKEAREWGEILWHDPCAYTRERTPCEHIDHIVPLADGGAHTWDNLTASSASANSRKSAKSLLHFLLEQT